VATSSDYDIVQQQRPAADLAAEITDGRADVCANCNAQHFDRTTNVCAQCRAAEIAADQRFNRMALSRRFLAYLLLVSITATILGLGTNFGYSFLLVGVAVPPPIFVMIYRAIKD
jgi:hypothetical protein